MLKDNINSKLLSKLNEINNINSQNYHLWKLAKKNNTTKIQYNMQLYHFALYHQPRPHICEVQQHETALEVKKSDNL